MRKTLKKDLLISYGSCKQDVVSLDTFTPGQTPTYLSKGLLERGVPDKIIYHLLSLYEQILVLRRVLYCS